MNILLTVAALIIILLMVVAGCLHWRLYKVNKRKHDQRMLQVREHQVVVDNNRNSIAVLARALIDDQVSLTEASIRIAVLAEALPESERSHFEVFQQLARATAHIPILDAWRQLSRKQQNAYDLERAAIEAKYRDFAIHSAKQFLNQ